MGMDRPIEKKKWPLKRIMIYSSFILLISIVVYVGISRTGGTTLNVERDRIIISTVKKGPFLEYIPIIGNVLPKTTIYLNAVEGGRVETRFLEAGAMVRKGDNILKLSNTNLLMTLLNNEAQINRARNDLRSTRLLLEQNRLLLEKDRNESDYDLKRIKDKYERYKALYDEGLIAKQDYEDYKNEYDYSVRKNQLSIETQQKNLTLMEQQVKDLETSVKRMEENLNLVKAQYENLTLRAPIAGQLTSLNAEPGQFKNPGDALGQIDEIHGYKVRADIDEHYLNRIEIGKTGTFDFSEKTYDLRIFKIFPEVKNGTFQVDLEFPGKEADGIKRGQSLHIRLQLSEATQAMLLPAGSFYQTTGGSWIFVLDESKKNAVKRPIRLGRQNPQFYEVLEGLKPGDAVITSSYDNYSNIERLTIK
ncbi:MAG: efflux RND transporter periplasmic adaptor subunit [Candidatus Omnitrophota bacterium]